jgi:hypothetical protein
MNLFEFNEAIKKVERHFKPIEDDLKRDDYFEFFKHLSEKFFLLVVDEIIKRHRGKWFPEVAEFEEVIEELERFQSYASIQDLENQEKSICPNCQNDGMIIEERLYLGEIGPIADFCTCDIGERRKRARQRYLKKKHIKEE